VLTAPHQPAQLAHAILRLLERPDDRARIGAAARARVTHEFDLEAGYARTLALYDELTGRRG
jgi:glycosyltransferase involved in cell wall biosynthesis